MNISIFTINVEKFNDDYYQINVSDINQSKTIPLLLDMPFINKLLILLNSFKALQTCLSFDYAYLVIAGAAITFLKTGFPKIK